MSSATARWSRVLLKVSGEAFAGDAGYGIDGRHDGIVVGNVLGSYAHLRHAGGNDWPARFVEFVRARSRAPE